MYLVWAHSCSRINVTKSLLAHHTVVWGYLVYCMFVCTIADLSAAEKDRGMKFCMHVRLLSWQIFHFGELWLVGSHGGGITSGMSYIHIAPGKKMPTYKSHLGKNWQDSLGNQNWPWLSVWGSQNWGRRHRVRPYGGICILQACWCTCCFKS